MGSQTGMTDKEADELDTLREIYNATLRWSRANPSMSTKAEVNQAQRIYYKRRIELDLAFAKAREDAGRRWREKQKLGISTGDQIAPLDPLDEKWNP